MRNDIMQQKRNSGFTMIELMIVIMIMGILIAIAIPSFASLIKRNNVEALQSKLSSAVGMARSEAASRNVIVSICKVDKDKSDDTCAGSDDDWSDGWVVFTDKGGDGAITTGVDEVIDVFINANDYTLNLATAAAFLSFSSQGFLTGGNEATFTVCEPKGDAAYARGLYISKSGLVMKTRDTNDSGKHNKPGSVDPLVCS